MWQASSDEKGSEARQTKAFDDREGRIIEILKLKSSELNFVVLNTYIFHNSETEGYVLIAMPGTVLSTVLHQCTYWLNTSSRRMRKIGSLRKWKKNASL